MIGVEMRRHPRSEAVRDSIEICRARARRDIDPGAEEKGSWGCMHHPRRSSTCSGVGSRGSMGTGMRCPVTAYSARSRLATRPSIEDVGYVREGGTGEDLLVTANRVGPGDLEQLGRRDTGTRAPPGGPLAVSHVSRCRNRRYDHIYLPATWKVQGMAYDLRCGADAGSDHAVVAGKVLVSDD